MALGHVTGHLIDIMKGGLVQAQRLENLFLEIVFKSLTGYPLDHDAEEPVSNIRILGSGTWLKAEVFIP
jgi:hypothetical protein